MGLLLWIVFGGLAGWLASVLMGTNRQQGALLNIAVGVVGAVIGGWLMSLVGHSGVTGFNLVSFAIAVLGAIVLLAVVRLFRGRTA
jgi:uncharacterized membrane protein YeaQ/YmgE (transglycosylase-associated protein family)